jgi:hypothetical protein
MAWLGTEYQFGPPSRLKGRFIRTDTGEKYTEPKARDFYTTDYAVALTGSQAKESL